jgi:hypothetical protein
MYQIIIDGPAETGLNNVNSFAFDVLAETDECFAIAEFCCFHLHKAKHFYADCSQKQYHFKWYGIS